MEKTSAVIDPATGAILNVIVADASVDQAPPGTMLIDATGSSVDTTWTYDLSTHVFIPPAN